MTDLPKKIYKYESFNNYSIANLKNASLYFNKPKNFNDPFECYIGDSFKNMTKEKWKKTYDLFLQDFSDRKGFIELFGAKPNKFFKEKITQDFNKRMEERKCKLLNERGISCFSETCDNILMWSHYADKHQGFCLEFDTNHKPFNKIKKVKYKNNMPHTPPLSVFSNSTEEEETAITKHKSWKYEKEWRLLHIEGDKLHGYPLEALTGIYFGANINPAHLEIICLIIQGQSEFVTFYETSLSENEYKINILKINEYIPYIKAKQLIKQPQ